MFTTEEFLGMTTTQSTSTKVLLIPEGEYTALIMADGIGVADFTYKRGEKEGQKGYRMTVKWEIDDPTGELEKQISRKPVIVQSIMLDITPEGGLDMGEGKNVQLGRLREAVGQNSDGQPWAPSMLVGQIAKIQVKHRIDDKNELQQEVTKVASMQ